MKDLDVSTWLMGFPLYHRVCLSPTCHSGRAGLWVRTSWRLLSVHTIPRVDVNPRSGRNALTRFVPPKGQHSKAASMRKSIHGGWDKCGKTRKELSQCQWGRISTESGLDLKNTSYFLEGTFWNSKREGLRQIKRDYCSSNWKLNLGNHQLRKVLAKNTHIAYTVVGFHLYWRHMPSSVRFPKTELCSSRTPLLSAQVRGRTLTFLN